MSVRFPQIANYLIDELIYQSDRTLVYRSRNEESGQSVAIKLMSNEYPSFGELVRFRNQYTIVKNLDADGIIKPYALERYENRYALIMEDAGGISLAEYQKSNSLSIPQFLDIASQLADILHQLHQNKIIHKDIKPANILIHRSTQQVKLIDFSISTLLPKETQTLQTPNVLEGTLAYLSPEQTGRMNRGIDYRSDFYSLGVTFYELLVGDVPFTQQDSLELIHAHIAQSPEPITRHQIPEVLSDIVLKLMAKNAEDRYQSALGLKYDLEKCRRQYRETGNIEPFVLGERDLCDRFLIPDKLYGREAEVAQLLVAFERVAGGGLPHTPVTETSQSARTSHAPPIELVLVAGYSGVGKTAVINEVHKPIVEKRGYFIKGKFDQFQRNIPFSAFVQAFRDLMGQLLGESDRQLQRWKEKILAALGDNGRAIVEVIPELENIIGEQPPVPELSGGAAQNRFNRLFQAFIRVFATPEHPLTIFIDDLQWADLASLKLMQLLMGDREAGYLLLLGAYRDNEVFPAHPLMLALKEIEASEATFERIALTPLSLADLNHLVADTLNCGEEQALPLTELVYAKTRGNPFFATQFLKGLHEDGWIVFNGDEGYWQCDLTQVQELSLSEDVVAFMAGRLHKIPEAARSLMKLAACIGNRFDLATLAIVGERSQTEAATELWAALQEGLILPSGESYKFFQGIEAAESDGTEVSVRYQFLHDRVQQAAYSLIPNAEKAAVHLHIGELLLRQTPSEQFEEQLFAIVNQLNIGAKLLQERDRREELARLNCRAAEKAKTATAYAGAIAYAEKGLSLLPSNSWETHYFLTRDLAVTLAEAEYLNVNFDRAEELIALVLERGKTLLEKIPAYKLQIGLELARYDYRLGLETGLQVLGQLGFPVDENARDPVQLPDTNAIESLPVADDPHYLAAMEIAANIYAAAVVGNPKMYEPLVARMVSLANEFGQSPTSAYAYVNYGMQQSGQGNLEVGYQAGLLGVGILDRFGDKTLKCKVYAVFNGFIRIWNEPSPIP